MRFTTLALCLAMTLVFSLAAVADQSRAEIESVYEKRYKSGAMRFLYGMFSGRSSDFVAYSQSGEPLDLDEQEAKWSAFLTKTVSITWTGEIRRFDYLSDTKVRCGVVEKFAAVIRNPTYAWRYTFFLNTALHDTWEYRGGKWEQVSSRIAEQYQGTEPYRRPSKP